MSSFAKMARNVSWNYVEVGVYLVVYFLLTPFIIEKLGVVGFGIWVLVNAIIYFLDFFDLGFYNALVKYVAEYGGRLRRVNSLVGIGFTALSMAGVAGVVVSLLVAWLVVPNLVDVPPERVFELQVAVVLLGVNLLLAFPLSVFSAIYTGYQRFDLLSVIAIALRLASAVAIVAGLSLGYGVLALVVIEIASTLLHALALWLMLHRVAPGVRVGWRPLRGINYRKIRAYSTWTAFDEMLVEGAPELEKLLIAIFLTAALLTPYSLICTVAAVVLLAIEPITDTFFPLSSAFDAKGDKGRLRELLLTGSKVVMSISLPLGVVILAFGEDFIHQWIGEEHIELPAAVLPLVVINFAVTACVVTGATILLALAHVRTVFWMTMAELALSISLMLALIPAAGLAGMATSLLIANLLLTFVWTIPFVCRLLDQPVSSYLWRSILRPAVALIPASAVAIGLNRIIPSDSLILVLLKGGGLGAVCLLLFWLLALESGERRQIIDRVKEIWTNWRGASGSHS